MAWCGVQSGVWCVVCDGGLGQQAGSVIRRWGVGRCPGMRPGTGRRHRLCTVFQGLASVVGKEVVESAAETLLQVRLTTRFVVMRSRDPCEVRRTMPHAEPGALTRCPDEPTLDPAPCLGWDVSTGRSTVNEWATSLLPSRPGNTNPESLTGSHTLPRPPHPPARMFS